jgi:dihydroneopterin aldolase
VIGKTRKEYNPPRFYLILGKGFSGMDMLFIDEMRVETRVGAYPWEKALPQTVLLNLKIALPESAGENDDLRATIDYANVVKRLRDALSGRSFNLLETLACCVADLLLTDFSVPWVNVSVTKPGILPNIKRVGVEIERRKNPDSPSN